MFWPFKGLKRCECQKSVPNTDISWSKTEVTELCTWDNKVKVQNKYNSIENTKQEVQFEK